MVDFCDPNPTADTIAVVIWYQLHPQLAAYPHLSATRPETDRNFVA